MSYPECEWRLAFGVVCSQRHSALDVETRSADIERRIHAKDECHDIEKRSFDPG
jgi:hypothetical protein